jgi:hypothetical protein
MAVPAIEPILMDQDMDCSLNDHARCISSAQSMAHGKSGLSAVWGVREQIGMSVWVSSGVGQCGPSRNPPR